MNNVPCVDLYLLTISVQLEHDTRDIHVGMMIPIALIGTVRVIITRFYVHRLLMFHCPHNFSDNTTNLPRHYTVTPRTSLMLSKSPGRRQNVLSPKDKRTNAETT